MLHIGQWDYAASTDPALIFAVALQYEPAAIPDATADRIRALNRRFADTLCIMMGIRPGDVGRILAVGLGLSLNDSYRVCPAGFDGRFADCNLYENGFRTFLRPLLMPAASTWETHPSPVLRPNSRWVARFKRHGASRKPSSTCASRAKSKAKPAASPSRPHGSGRCANLGDVR